MSDDMARPASPRTPYGAWLDEQIALKTCGASGLGGWQVGDSLKGCLGGAVPAGEQRLVPPYVLAERKAAATTGDVASAAYVLKLERAVIDLRVEVEKLKMDQAMRAKEAAEVAAELARLANRADLVQPAPRLTPGVEHAGAVLCAILAGKPMPIERVRAAYVALCEAVGLDFPVSGRNVPSWWTVVTVPDGEKVTGRPVSEGTP